MESRQWMIAEAIAHTAGPDTVVFRRDIELLATDPVWERAHGDPDTLAAIWCTRDQFRTLTQAVDYYLPSRSSRPSAPRAPQATPWLTD